MNIDFKSLIKYCKSTLNYHTGECASYSIRGYSDSFHKDRIQIYATLLSILEAKLEEMSDKAIQVSDK